MVAMPQSMLQDDSSAPCHGSRSGVVFNTLRRDAMLKLVLDVITQLYPFVYQAYSTSSVLKFGDMIMSS